MDQLAEKMVEIDQLINEEIEKIDSKIEKIEAILTGGQSGFKFIKLESLAQLLGTPEVAIRFTVALLSGIIFAILYNLIRKAPPAFKHLYLTVCGLTISYFCFGPDAIHGFITIFTTYISVVLIGGTMSHVIFSFLFHLTYLIGGYLYTATDLYDVKWTTPQCILCLRLIGLAWDVYDGQRNEESLSADQKATCFKRKPTLMEICGYSYLFGGLLVGPQFSFRRYMDFVEETLIDPEVEKRGPSRFLAGAKRLSIGIFVVVIFTQLDVYFRPDDVLQKSFLEKPWYVKVVHMTLVYLVQFTKYIVVWQISESACIVSGISYNGAGKDGRAKWDGLKNFSSKKFLFFPFFQSMVDGFNINTNQWVGRYVFRRLRFLGNRTLSHVLTLAFLAIWHGFYVGYFITFGLEFIVMMTERSYQDFFWKLTGRSLSELPGPTRYSVHVLLALLKTVCCGFCAQAFLLLRWRRIKIAYGAVYYWVPVYCAVWLVLAPILRFLFLKKRKADVEPTKPSALKKCD